MDDNLLMAPASIRASAQPEVAANDAVLALRSATSALHRRLDDGLPLGKPGATLADYADHLRMLKAWQIALQPWLARTATCEESHAMIDLDLQDCPQTANSADDDRLDLAPLRAADDGSEAFCWGIRYVLEGSRLGGQVLYRMLREPLAPHPLRYLGQRASTLASWHDTLNQLRRNLASDAQRQSACRGAIAAFELLLANAKPLQESS